MTHRYALASFWPIFQQYQLLRSDKYYVPGGDFLCSFEYNQAANKWDCARSLGK